MIWQGKYTLREQEKEDQKRITKEVFREKRTSCWSSSVHSVASLFSIFPTSVTRRHTHLFAIPVFFFHLSPTRRLIFPASPLIFPFLSPTALKTRWSPPVGRRSSRPTSPSPFPRTPTLASVSPPSLPPSLPLSPLYSCSLFRCGAHSSYCSSVRAGFPPNPSSLPPPPPLPPTHLLKKNKHYTHLLNCSLPPCPFSCSPSLGPCVEEAHRRRCGCGGL